MQHEGDRLVSADRRYVYKHTGPTSFATGSGLEVGGLYVLGDAVGTLERPQLPLLIETTTPAGRAALFECDDRQQGGRLRYMMGGGP